MRDRVLIEARAKGLTDADIEAALRHPFRQLLKPDIIISAVAVSVMLLIYYTAVAFSVIYLTTVFGFSVKDANGLGNWNWGFNVIAVILIGFVSDRFRVRKPFMVIGGVAGRGDDRDLPGAGRPPSRLLHARDHAGAAGASAWAWPTPRGWPASPRPSRPATRRSPPPAWPSGAGSPGDGLHLVPDHPGRGQLGHPAGRLRGHGGRRTRPSTRASSPSRRHPNVVAAAQSPVGRRHRAVDPAAGPGDRAEDPAVRPGHRETDATQLANAQKFAPELAVIEANPALFAKLATYTNPATIPPALRPRRSPPPAAGPRASRSWPRSRPTRRPSPA